MSLAPVIGPTGIIAPTFADILASLQGDMQAIYGADIYIDPDSQDGQILAIIAKAIKDENDAVIAAYNSFSPATAQGTGLSNNVKINGIRRLVPSNSQVVQRVTGQVGIPIIGGQICDPNIPGVRWALPNIAEIPIAGYIDVTATCLTEGAVQANANTLTQIVTPTRGWQSTNNAAAATPGMPVESDAALRRRQSQSTAIPALSVVNSIQGNLENLIGVGRCKVYENDTGTTDGNGIPAHSISAVVEGGDVMSIAQVIAQTKTPGTGTYGTTTETVTDGVAPPIDINFYELAIIDIFVLAVGDAETGYASSTAGLIAASLAAWFNALTIGQDSQYSKLWSPINLSGDAAVAGASLTQQQLDALSDTYNITELYQARQDMTAEADYPATTTAITITNVTDLAIGKLVACALDDGSFHLTSVSNKVGNVITIAAGIPTGRSMPENNLMYVLGDLTIAFNEAAGGDPTLQTIEIS